jgi:hypothetical protein
MLEERGSEAFLGSLQLRKFHEQAPTVKSDEVAKEEGKLGGILKEIKNHFFSLYKNPSNETKEEFLERVYWGLMRREEKLNRSKYLHGQEGGLTHYQVLLSRLFEALEEQKFFAELQLKQEPPPEIFQGLIEKVMELSEIAERNPEWLDRVGEKQKEAIEDKMKQIKDRLNKIKDDKERKKIIDELIYRAIKADTKNRSTVFQDILKKHLGL